MKNHILMALIILLLLPATLFAREYTLKNYKYPYKDPYFSSLTSVLAGLTVSNAESESYVEQVVKYVDLIPGRDDLPFIYGSTKAGYSFFYNNEFSKQDRKNRPLVFIISGLGGSHLYGTSVFLAELLVRQGNNVITISSPFQRLFTAFASATGSPGLTAQDSEDIYRIMYRALGDLEINENYRPQTISLVGYSLGALESAYIAKIDEKRKNFDFKKVVMINPPVNLDTSTKKIDASGWVFKLLGPKKQKRLVTKLYNLAFTYTDSNDDTPAEIFLLNLDKLSPFTPDEVKALIGFNFINVLSGSLFYAELINNFGLFNHDMGISPQTALRVTQGFTYERYYTEILYKKIKQKRKDYTLKKMNDENSLSNLASYIKNSSKFYLMHNKDDIILSEGELDFARSLIPAKNQYIYPRGGHLGNIWFDINKRDFLNIFN